MIIFVIIAAVFVFVIAAVSVGRETARLDALPPSPAFELVDSVGWIAERLPEEVSAQISYEDVRDITLWHIEAVSALDEPADGHPNDEVVIVDESLAVQAVIDRAAAAGRTFETSHVSAVISLLFQYLEQIGAVGPMASPEPE